MAANFPDMHAMYVRLGFSVNASDDIINLHQFTDVDMLRRLRETDVDSLCKTLKSPGGTVPHPTVPQAFVPNPGREVSIKKYPPQDGNLLPAAV